MREVGLEREMILSFFVCNSFQHNLTGNYFSNNGLLDCVLISFTRVGTSKSGMVCPIMVHHGEYVPSLCIRYLTESSWWHATEVPCRDCC